MATAPAVIVQPNVFELEGYDMRLSFATTSITGVPELTLVTRGETLKFRGDQIRSEKTTIGQLVSVALTGQSAQAPAGQIEILSLVVPAVTLPAGTKQAAVQTLALLTLKAATVKSASQTQAHLPLFLAGSAQQIDF